MKKAVLLLLLIFPLSGFAQSQDRIENLEVNNQKRPAIWFSVGYMLRTWPSLPNSYRGINAYNLHSGYALSGNMGGFGLNIGTYIQVPSNKLEIGYSPSIRYDRVSSGSKGRYIKKWLLDQNFSLLKYINLKGIKSNNSIYISFTYNIINHNAGFYYDDFHRGITYRDIETRAVNFGIGYPIRKFYIEPSMYKFLDNSVPMLFGLRAYYKFRVSNQKKTNKK